MIQESEYVLQSDLHCFSSLIAGWCFFNEAHVAVLDADYRDFENLHEICVHCPKVCCMTATLQPSHVAQLEQKLGRSGCVSKSMLLSPKRMNLSLVLQITVDARLWICSQLSKQNFGQRAIVFCLFKKSVAEVAAFLRSQIPNRDVFECTSGATSNLSSFKLSRSAIMVCTSVLEAGVSFDDVTRIFFLDCAHGPEKFLQGAGRGARADSDNCVAALVTTTTQLEYFTNSNMTSTAEFAVFCQHCILKKLDFAQELYALYDHQHPRAQRFATKRARSNERSSGVGPQIETSAAMSGQQTKQPPPQQKVCATSICNMQCLVQLTSTSCIPIHMRYVNITNTITIFILELYDLKSKTLRI